MTAELDQLPGGLCLPPVADRTGAAVVQLLRHDADGETSGRKSCEHEMANLVRSPQKSCFASLHGDALFRETAELFLIPPGFRTHAEKKVGKKSSCEIDTENANPRSGLHRNSFVAIFSGLHHQKEAAVFFFFF